MTVDKDTIGGHRNEWSLFRRFRWLDSGLLLLAMCVCGAAGFFGVLHYLDSSAGPQRPPKIREEFFTAGASGLKLLGSGWAYPEQWGTWSLGPSAALSWTLDAEPLDSLHLTVEGRAFPVAGERSQSIDVDLNGTRLGTVESSSDGKLRNNTFVISRRVAMRSVPMKIVFSIAMPVSPQDLNLGDDNRKIGLGLTSVVLSY